MAAYDILFADPGGEYYSGLGLGAAGVWTAVGGSGTLTSSAPAGRATTYAIGANNGFWKATGSNYASWCCGMAVNTALPISSFVLFALRDLGSYQITLNLDANGHLIVTRGNTTTLATSTNLLTANTWHYIEVSAVINSTTGSVTVWVDGAAWLTLTGQNTQATANAYANQAYFFNNASPSYFKDVYMMADTGSGLYSSKLGDITVAVLYPNAAGVNQAWTLGAGASQTAAVQDGITHSGTFPDGDTSYIDSATAGQISDFAHQALSLTGSILAVVMVGYMRKDDAGTRQAANVCLSGGTESDGATQSLGGTYQYYFDVLEKDPHTNAAWTLANFNAATFGVKEIS